VPQRADRGQDLNDSYELIQDEPSFSEAVLSDPGVESMISTPISERAPKLEMVVDEEATSQDETADTFNSYETAI